MFEAVRELSATDQRIVELCLYEGRSYKEAALQLGLSVTASPSGSTRSRTLRRLRDEEDAQATT